MAYGDRMTISIKDFGRKVEIGVKRGKILELPKAKKITVLYADAPARVPKGRRPPKKR
jgi:hypothetical protein